MAGPMQLIECTAEVLGIEVSTLVTHDRNLVVAGLRNKGGRGSSAARMTAGDATNLLVAAVGSEQVRGSVAAVQRFCPLVVRGPRAGTPLPNLQAGHTFGEAIKAFIQGFVDDDFCHADCVTINISMERPTLKANISGEIFGQFEATYFPLATQVRDPPPDGDLQITTRFTQVTLWRIGELLRT